MSDRDDSDRDSKERDRSPCKKRRRDGGQLRTDPSRYKTKLCSAWMDRNTQGGSKPARKGPPLLWSTQPLNGARSYDREGGGFHLPESIKGLCFFWVLNPVWGWG